jgi:small-conductance mechanosensitive channel
MLSKAKNRARQAAAGAVIKAAGKAESVTDAPGELDDVKHEATAKGAGGLLADNKAAADASRAVEIVVALVVGGLMAAFLLPIAIDEIVAVDTSSWTNGASSLWDILPVMIVLAIFLFFVGLALRRSRM